jgi:hypothetical protein
MFGREVVSDYNLFNYVATYCLEIKDLLVLAVTDTYLVYFNGSKVSFTSAPDIAAPC